MFYFIFESFDIFELVVALFMVSRYVSFSFFLTCWMFGNIWDNFWKNALFVLFDNFVTKNVKN